VRGVPRLLANINGLSLNFRQLSYFVRIAELGSFSRAAAELRIAQSALSYQISQLEDELRVQLLVRSGRGASLTEAGRSVLDHARNVIRELNELRADAGSSAQFPSGHVAFAAPPSVARILIPPVIERFRADYPDVRLSMREENADAIYDWLLKGEIDFGLIYDFPETSELESIPLLSDRMCLVGAPSLPRPAASDISAAGLETLPLVVTSTRYNWRRRLEKALVERNLALNIQAEVDSLSVIKELVRSGFGYSFLPASVLYFELREESLWAMPVPDLPLSSTLILLRVKHRAPSLAGNELKRLLVEEARRLSASGWGMPATDDRLLADQANGR